MTRSAWIGVLLIAATATGTAQQGARGGGWTRFAGDAGSTRYAPLDQINKDNVARLRVAWQRPAVDPSISSRVPGFSHSNNYRATPLMIDGVLYSPNGIGLVEAFHPGTGRTIWVQQPFPDDPDKGLRGEATRGVAYWAEDATRRLFVIRGEYLIALDLRTGKPVTTFGDRGRVFLRPGLGPRAEVYRWTGVPHVCRDVVILGATMSDSPARKESLPPGNIQAFDVRTGKPRWTFRTVPFPGDYGSATWEGNSAEYGGASNPWAPLSSDEELGLAYLATGSASHDIYGGERPGDNLFANTLLCLKCATGERVWHHQLVHHDLWDYDLPTAPVLADVTVGGTRIKVVVQLTKQAFAFVFDRTNGKPVWPIEERPVPKSDTPGERAAATQPFPTKPPAFDRQGVSIDDLIDFTPELRKEAIELVRNYRTGPMFTPPTLRDDRPGGVRGTLQLPGSQGGADVQGGALDPQTGMLDVQSITGPFIADLVARDPKTSNLAYGPGRRAWAPGPQGLPLFKPPYGRITAIDLNKGEIAWMVPHGEGPRGHPLLKPLNLPPLGNPGRASPLLTRTLLFIGEGSPAASDRGQRLLPEMPASLVPATGDRKFHAYDKATGASLWVGDLPAGTTGAPMTYMFEGKQYIVVAIGDDAPNSAGHVAFALP